MAYNPTHIVGRQEGTNSHHTHMGVTGKPPNTANDTLVCLSVALLSWGIIARVSNGDIINWSTGTVRRC